MRKSKFTDSEIVDILRTAALGVAIVELARAHGVSAATLYVWRAKYGELDASEIHYLSEMKRENSNLQRVYAKLSKKHAELKQLFRTNASSIQRRSIVDWAIRDMHFSERRACRLFSQRRGTQRRTLRNFLPTARG